MYKKIFSCKDKVAIVIGGAGLLGREIVRALGDFGAKVYCADISKKKIVTGKIPHAIKYSNLDIRSERSIGMALKKIELKEKRVDILVNCAYPRTGDWGATLEKVSFESWKENVDNHMGGYFMTCKLAAQMMKSHGGGVIINLASIYGIAAPDFSIYEDTQMTMPVAYAAIKGGIINLTKYFASYYGRYNIRVNAISPGGIFDNQNPEFEQKYSKKTMLRRMGTPGDVVGAVVYLCSDAAAYITGANIVVDGGWTV
ncbi:MAG: SDR family oxidoreductase [Candidatus Pacebacteria bacterium]|nr:SDR family oxidoreductase [Candidatus Paceibacterota bacterium]